MASAKATKANTKTKAKAKTKAKTKATATSRTEQTKAKAKPASISTLAKRAKAGDADALADLQARTRGAEAEAAARAIGTLATPEALTVLAELIAGHERSEVRFAAENGLERLVKKYPAARETLIQLAADERVYRHDAVLATLYNTLVDHRALRDDPRVVTLLRNVLAARAQIYAQRVAVEALALIGDTASIPTIAALLQHEKWRGPFVVQSVAESLDTLQAGADVLEKLRATRARISDKRAGRKLDRVIARMAKRLE